MFARSATSVLSAFVAGAVLVPGSSALDETWRDQVARLCEETVAAEASGLSVAIALRGEIVLARGFGRAEGHEVEAGTAYAAGSFVEPLLAGVVLALADARELVLEDPVTTWFPELAFGDEAVTVEQLLTHTSGIPDYADLARVLSPEERHDADRSTERVLEFLRASTLESAPGSCFEFSRSNTLLLCMIVEAVTEEPFADHVQREVFEFASMANTSYCDADPDAREMAPMLHQIGGELVRVRDLPGRFSTARLCTNVFDLLAWLQACSEGELVSESSARRMRRAVRLTDGTDTGHALAFERASLDEAVNGFSFGGGVADTCLRVTTYPEAGLSVALLGTGSVSLGPLERSLARAVLGLRDPGVRDLPLEREDRVRYVGGYYVGCSRYGVREADGRLEVVPPEGPLFRLRYQGKHRFLALDDAGVRVEFLVSESGRAVGFTLDRHGVEYHATRLEERDLR